jgi:hypothetical protein
MGRAGIGGARVVVETAHPASRRRMIVSKKVGFWERDMRRPFAQPRAPVLPRGEVAAPIEERWEYKALALDDLVTPRRTEVEFNRLGYAGWEFVAMNANSLSGKSLGGGRRLVNMAVPMAIFKRRAKPHAAELGIPE